MSTYSSYSAMLTPFKDNEGRLCHLHDCNGNSGVLSIYLTTKLSLPNEGLRTGTFQTNRFCHHVIQDNKEKIFDASMYTPIFIDDYSEK